jgi:hypothetical protein
MTATATLLNGAVADYTNSVLWSSSSANIYIGQDPSIHGLIAAVGAGILQATDPSTGIYASVPIDVVGSGPTTVPPEWQWQSMVGVCNSNLYSQLTTAPPFSPAINAAFSAYNYCLAVWNPRSTLTIATSGSALSSRAFTLSSDSLCMNQSAWARDMSFCEQANDLRVQGCAIAAGVAALKDLKAAALSLMICLRFSAAQLQQCYQQATIKNGRMCQLCDTCQPDGSCQPTGLVACGQVCCTGPCAPEGGCCPADRVCGSACCSAAQTCCGGQCVDLETDPQNCGSCGNTCTSGTCCAGLCCSGCCCTWNCPNLGAGSRCILPTDNLHCCDEGPKDIQYPCSNPRPACEPHSGCP